MISALRLVQTKRYLSFTHNCDRALKCELHFENEQTGNYGIYEEGNTTTLILVKGKT